MNGDDRQVIVHVVNSLESGGTERTLVALLRAFNASRFRHVLATLRNAGPLAEQLPDNVACQAFGTYRSCWRTGIALAALCRRWKAAALHARNTGCWYDSSLAALLSPGARLILGFHGLQRPGPLSDRHRRLAHWAARAGARFASVSAAGRQQLIEQAHIPPQQVVVLRNGVECRAFAPRGGDAARGARRAALGLSDSEFVVGTVASLTPVKQHAMLIRALAGASLQVPNIRLLIVGDGPLRTALARQADEAGIDRCVRFLGWRADVPEVLSCLDAYVCSSASEGMSNSVLEAMAASLPIVATDVGDNAVMLRNNVDGCIVKPDSADSIAGALVMLGRSPGLRRHLGAAAAARARDYSFEHTVRAYEEYYQSILAPTRRPHTASGEHVTGQPITAW